jgi:hypothetical protein
MQDHHDDKSGEIPAFPTGRPGENRDSLSIGEPRRSS